MMGRGPRRRRHDALETRGIEYEVQFILVLCHRRDLERLTAADLAYAAAAADTNADSEGIPEIVVTAQRRTENMQEVPITIQALTAETLTQLNVSTFDDFVKYLPNVTAATRAPAKRTFICAASAPTGCRAIKGAAPPDLSPTSPSLDEQSGQAPGRNLDVYAATSIESKCSKVLRARSSAPAPKRACCDT